MAQNLPADYDATLYYCVKTLAEAIFLEELNEVAAKNPNLSMVTICTDQNQRITAQQAMAPEVEEYLLCAPPAMMRDLEKQLVAQGVPRNSIHYEDFALVWKNY